MKTYCITGAASGIGQAVANLVRDKGHQVISVDLKDADVIGDLGTPEGRQAAIDGVLEKSEGKLDGFVPAAGISTGFPPELIVKVNYFGVRALLDGLRPALAKGDKPAVVMVSSNTSAVTPNITDEDLAAYLNEDEAAACEHYKGKDFHAYPSGKLAVARWMRTNAAEWMKTDGIRLNAVAPGIIETNMTKDLFTDPEMLKQLKAIPLADDRWGKPEEIAYAVWFLLNATYTIGQTIYVDGGTEIIVQPTAYPASFTM